MHSPATGRRWRLAAAIGALTCLALAIGCSPVTPLELYGTATEDLPQLQDKELRVEEGAGVYRLHRSADGYYEVVSIRFRNKNGKFEDIAKGSPDWNEATQSGKALFLTNRIRVYEIDPQKFDLSAASQALEKHLVAFDSKMQGLAQQGNEAAAEYLKQIAARPQADGPYRYLLFTIDVADPAWNADGERGAPSAKLLSQDAAIPEIPYSRTAALIPRDVMLPGADVILAGSREASGLKLGPRGERCHALKDAPKWIVTTCVTNFAERRFDDGTRWQSGFQGLVAGDPDALRAAIHQLADGMTAVPRTRDAEEAKQAAADPKTGPASGQFLRVY